MFPKARAAIKYLVADGRYDYIETGSLMSIRKNVKDITIPYVLHTKDLKEENGIVYLPLYMTMLL